MSNVINLNSISDKACFLSIVLCLFSSTICTLSPLISWSYFSPKEIKLSCAIEWRHHSVNAMSFNVATFFFAFIIPLVIIAVTNIKIFKIVISLIDLIRKEVTF